MRFLKTIINKPKPRHWLLLILLLGLLLRINRLEIGFPGLFVSNDEAIYHQSALNMLANRTVFTIGNYGPLGSYVQIPFLILAYLAMLLTGTVSNIKGMEYILLTQEGYLLFIPRAISALFGVLSVLVIYKLSKELFKEPKAALWSAFFAAVSFNLVHVSHLARAWSPAAFFSLLSLYFAIKSVNSARGKLIVLSFASAAMAFGFHQLSGLMILLIISIGMLHVKIIKWRFLSAGFALWAILIILFNFLSLQGNFWTALAVGGPTSTGLTLFPKDPLNLNGWVEFFGKRINFFKVILDLITTDGVLVLLALAFVLTKKIHSKIHRLVWLYITFNFVLISVVFPPFIRYFLIGFSFLPIYAGYTFNYFLKLKPNMFIVVGLITLALFNSIYWNVVLTRQATFEQMTDWVEKNIQPTETILISHRRNFPFVPSKKSADFTRISLPGYYARSTEVIGDTYPPNVRDVIYLEPLGLANMAGVKRVLDQMPVKYVMTSYYALNGRLPLEQEGLKPVAHFSPTGEIVYRDKIPEALFDAPYFMPLFKLFRAGPYIDVFKVE